MKTITSLTLLEGEEMQAERDFVRMLSGDVEASKLFRFVRLRVYPAEGYEVNELEYLKK